jgi:hypothetical protein
MTSSHETETTLPLLGGVSAVPSREFANAPELVRTGISMRPAPEIVVGLVGAVGTPLDLVAEKLEQSFSRVAYKAVNIRLSDLLKAIPQIGSVLKNFPEAERIKTAMEAGSLLREKLVRGDALAGLAVSQLKLERDALGGTFEEHVYILRQLKHHEEVNALRGVYRDQFILLGVYMPRSMRVARLAERLARSEGKRRDEFRAKAGSPNIRVGVKRAS